MYKDREELPLFGIEIEKLRRTSSVRETSSGEKWSFFRGFDRENV